ncbi:flagellin FliC [Aquabacterium fontiphilum]|uniref:flagellin N-terminal helical domain-containing protein n=1 Tax=Aquabacterium fontiphilum TaxID=450365 RepID=UPI001377FB2A|nr:flagellin [Aquabacterium fontiphilum]NBD19634.1 flagellin FliC [Aquabacterium fontiphilum]
MPQTINTNIISLNAQRNLNTSQTSLATSMQRLSSGLRVNSAKDDAAGLAIAERMNSQVRGMNVAIRNANDAISLAQTAEGALGKIGDNLQRMRELAIQSRNATNSDGDRANLQKEFRELQKEISRTINSTSFNNKRLFDGSAEETMSFQVGAGTTEYDRIELSSVNMVSNTAGDTTPVAASRTTLGAEGNPPPTADASIADVLQTVVMNVAQDGSTAANAEGLAIGGFQDDGTTPVDGTIIDETIRVIDGALDKINDARATFGAAQNRFEAVIANLQVNVENQAAARGRIMDADFAAETANLSRAQILQQAGTAMVSQANQLPQQVLSLLGR